MTLPIGEAIRHVRKTKGLTCSELARRAHISRSTVSMLEHGHKTPRLDLLIRLANALGVEPHKLVKLICKMRTVPDLETITDSALT
jgi:transcriptional regulator with XRE-family HTH domain